MTGAAVRSGFDDIRAAIPFRRLLRVGLIAARPEVERVPEHHRLADVERERQLVRIHRVADRFNGLEISADRQHIVVAQLGIGGIRHRRIEALTVVASALMQGGKELFVGPTSDTRLAIGRDVCSDDLSEGSFQRQPACERLPAGRCMTCGAIAEHRKVASAFDPLETLGLLRRCCPSQGNNETSDGEMIAHRSLFTSANPGSSNSDP